MPDDPTQHSQQQPQAPSQPPQGAPAPHPSPDTPETQGGPQEPNTERDLDQVTDVSALRSEAASRRRALREVEQERDQLRGRIDGMQRETVERQAAERFADVSDVWSVTSLDQLRGEDGQVDMGLVDAEFSRIERAKPHWRKGGAPSDADTHPGARQPAPTEGPSFGDSIKRAFRGG